MNQSRFIYRGGEAQIEEKKSRFIATVAPVRSEEEAQAFLAGIKKKYWDARHNCYAFVTGPGGRLQRSSDDGEPQGTAGRPILEVIRGAAVEDCIVVVTRYFGGILLGTGGLVRAYQKAAREGLEACGIAERTQGYRLYIRTDYTDIGRLQYLFAQKGWQVENTEYAEAVTTELLVAEDELGPVRDAVTESTGGRAVISPEEAVCFARTDEGTLFF